MKNLHFLSKIKLPVAFAATAFSVALLAAAEPEGQPRRPAQQPGDRGDRPGADRPALHGRPSVFESVLDDEQREELRDAMEASREKMQEIERKIGETRRGMEELLFAEKVDEKAIHEKAVAVADLEAQRMILRAKALAKIRASLTPDQLEKMKNMRVETSRAQRPDSPPTGEVRPRGVRDGGQDRPERADVPPRRAAPEPR